MSETKLPGIKVSHVIITPVCRRNRTAGGAFKEAVNRLLFHYIACQVNANNLADFHLALTVDSPITTEDGRHD